LNFRLEDIPREGREVEAEQDPGWLDERLAREERKPFRLLGPVRIHLTLSRSGRTVLVQSRIRAEAEFSCDRCLEPFASVLSSEFKATLKPKPHISSNPEREIERDDLETEFYEGEEFDLTPLLQDQLLLTLPSKSVCREDCRGLCQRCGQNRNRGTCQCTDQESDPRLEPLKKFQV
jgi:uncharacterized protein